MTGATKSDYQLHSDGRFAIKGYNQKRPFSNFLPGIAGLYGTPMWAFYVSRGQGIASFGTKNKDNAILEFFPANKAYQNTPHLGFRTFVKVKNSKSNPTFYEPFQEKLDSHSPTQIMEVSSHELRLEETHTKLGLKFEVTYFTVPGEPLAVLARELSVTNISSHPIDIEILDGLPQVNPYGMNEFFVKNMSRTIEAWMLVENMEKGTPFFRLRVDATDRPEVEIIEEGNFFFSIDASHSNKLLEVIVDPAKVFGSMLDFSCAKEFFLNTPFHNPKDQVLENKTPSAFSLASAYLAPSKSKKIHSYFGQAKNLKLLNHYVSRAKNANYFEEKRLANKKLIEGIKSPIFMASSSSVFDLYAGQTYLDNVLRGGMPICVGPKDNELVFHVYSRKHGDLERDYNRFLVEPAYFAQGDGNYRDVNQNRRSDVYFEPRVKDLNIKTFLNLIQLDGFNPLVTKGTTFHLANSKDATRSLLKYFSKKDLTIVTEFAHKHFTLGEFCRFLENKQLLPSARFESFLKEINQFLVRDEQAEHGEGFWVDHWTYNLDLIESYLGIYPDQAKDLLFEREEFTFYDSDHIVKPREEKYFLKEQGVVRQYQSVFKDKDKAALIQSRLRAKNMVRTKNGRGDIYTTSLFVKLISLFMNKLASLDAHGVGIEMEADKPSWYDALNGLPGLLGSSLCETFELKRLSLFMIQAMDELGLDLNQTLSLPEEMFNFFKKLETLLEKHLRSNTAKDHYLFWDIATKAKEDYRLATKFGLSGKEKKITLAQLKVFLEHGREKIEIGIDKAYDKSTGLYPTYFQNEVIKYKKSKKEGMVFPLEFKQTPLPFFLEGPVHAMKVERDPERRRKLVKAVRQSKLYDTKLGMYRVNTSLSNTSFEIGRARVFKPGWLENESIWLHMEYKWILELLKNGMVDEFFADFKKVLIPFQKPEQYGRSILENSSFIASSAFSDASIHGAGFVARLSGSTAEFLSIWFLLMVGKKPFRIGHDGKLSLHFQPLIPASMFLKENKKAIFHNKDGEEQKIDLPSDSLAFMFLGKTIVVYHNPRGLDTFGKLRVQVKKIILKDTKGNKTEFRGDTIPSPHSQKIRDGFVPRIDVELG